MGAFLRGEVSDPEPTGALGGEERNKFDRLSFDGLGVRLCRVNKFGFPCSEPRKKHPHSWKTGDFAYCKGATGRVVVQSATRLEIRVNGKRIGGQLIDFKKYHSKDAYSYC